MRRPAHGRLRHDQRAARAALGLAGAAHGTTDVVARRLVAAPRRRAPTSHAHRRATSRSTCGLRRTQPTAAAGRGGRQPQGSRGQRRRATTTAARSSRERHGRRRGRHAHAVRRHRVARSRMVERVPRRGGARLGLDRHQPRRRRRADGVPHPRQRRRRLTGRAARCAQRGRPRARLAPSEIRFEPLRRWRSPRTGTTYPVAMAGARRRAHARARAADGRPGARLAREHGHASTGKARYRAGGGPPAGRGYLELTGYRKPVRF